MATTHCFTLQILARSEILEPLGYWSLCRPIQSIQSIQALNRSFSLSHLVGIRNPESPTHSCVQAVIHLLLGVTKYWLLIHSGSILLLIPYSRFPFQITRFPPDPVDCRSRASYSVRVASACADDFFRVVAPRAGLQSFVHLGSMLTATAIAIAPRTFFLTFGNSQCHDITHWYRSLTFILSEL